MTEPVSIELARAQCSLVEGDTSRDTELNAYIAAARDFVETETGQILVQREITQTLDGFPCDGTGFDLDWRPITEVSGISYVDTESADQDFDDFAPLLGRYPVRVFAASGASWPTTLDNSAVTVTYTAGYADGEVPPGLIQAMLLLIGHWFENRETVAVGLVSSEVQFAANALIAPRRTMVC